jgi:hypothetical protein
MPMERYLLRSTGIVALFKTVLTGRRSHKIVEVSYEVDVTDPATTRTFGNWLDADHFYRAELARRSQNAQAIRDRS